MLIQAWVLRPRSGREPEIGVGKFRVGVGCLISEVRLALIDLAFIDPI